MALLVFVALTASTLLVPASNQAHCSVASPSSPHGLPCFFVQQKAMLVGFTPTWSPARAASLYRLFIRTTPVMSVPAY